MIVAGAAVCAALAGTESASGQEFVCQVEVNSQAIEGTSKSVFETLQESITDYMNETKFSNATFANNEKIDCRMMFTIKEYADDRMKGDLQVQLSRPVYNSSYTTTLLNFRDTRIEFDYKEGDPLVFSESSINSNLEAILNFYAYLFLALDFDSFSPKGGQPYYERAASVVQAAQSLGSIGWRAFEDPKNRSGILSSFTDGNMEGIREMLYTYHRRGLDEMATSPDKGRAAITGAVESAVKAINNAPMSAASSLFRDAKLDELVNVYSKAPEAERMKVYDLLQPLYPADRDRMEEIKNPPTR
ncbi:MAG: DUF4835 family protein [Muribaculaceae bacterium]|nr:DUF4835 family protein [Muribaculaceae bacterium]